MLNDLRYALRMLLKNPGFAAVAVLTLALGIGFVTTIFTIVNGVAFGRLPFEDSKQIVSIGVDATKFDDLAREQTSCDPFGFVRTIQTNVRAGTGVSRYSGAIVSENSLDVLRVRPSLGRGFTREDASPVSPKTVLIGHKLWVEEFRGASDVVGRLVHINGEPRTVVGVMPEGFGFPRNEALWMVRQAGEPVEADSICFGRLKVNVTRQQAGREFAALAIALDPTRDHNALPPFVEVASFTERAIKPQMRVVLSAVLGATLLVLLLACANVTNLILSRCVERQRELAVRAALGASRGKLIRQLLIESLLVSSLGAVGGIFIAWASTQWVWSYLGQESALTGGAPFWVNFNLDARVIIVVAGLTVLATLLTGLAPAIQTSRQDLTTSLKQGGGSGLRLSLANRLLINAQLALSVCLVIVAGLFLTILLAFNQKHLPYDPAAILTARVALDDSRYPSPAQRTVFYGQLLESIQAIPGIESACLTSSDRFRAPSVRLELEGNTYPRPSDRPASELAIISDGYFDTFPASIQEGRAFSTADQPDTVPVAIVNRSFAESLGGAKAIVGRRVRIGNDAEPWLTIVGIATDLGSVKAGQASSGPVLYRPMSQVPQREMTVLIRSTASPSRLVSDLRQAVARVDAETPVYQFLTALQIIELERIGINVPAALFIVCGLGALVLATVGVYGVVSFSVRLRTRELGVRLALGATRAGIVSLILRQGLVQISVGIAIGLLLAMAGSMLLHSTMTGLGHSAFNVWIYLAVAVLLAAVGALALVVPALRGSRVDPMVALRAE